MQTCLCHYWGISYCGFRQLWSRSGVRRSSSGLSERRWCQTPYSALRKQQLCAQCLQITRPVKAQSNATFPLKTLAAQKAEAHIGWETVTHRWKIRGRCYFLMPCRKADEWPSWLINRKPEKQLISRRIKQEIWGSWRTQPLLLFPLRQQKVEQRRGGGVISWLPTHNVQGARVQNTTKQNTEWLGFWQNVCPPVFTNS